MVLVNLEPGHFIMTDPEMADRTYIEPITPEIVEQIIAVERPDAVLPTLGGQTGLERRPRGSWRRAGHGWRARVRPHRGGAAAEAIRKAEGP